MLPSHVRFSAFAININIPVKFENMGKCTGGGGGYDIVIKTFLEYVKLHNKMTGSYRSQ